MIGPLAAALALALLAFPARAEEDLDAALCERAIVNGARRAGVPAEVLHAVALTETGRETGGRVRPFPWAINREGQGHWFKTREEALAFAKQSVADGRPSFDVGCVQINYRWHGHAFPSLDDMFDPEWTATYAGQFLRTLYEERGDWSQAAGAYHSLTADKAAIYRERFDRILAGLEPGALSADETLMAAVPDMGGRGARRRAQRDATVRRIREADPTSPPVTPPVTPPTVMGSLAGVSAIPAGPGLLGGGGSPILAPGAGPLFTPASGGLF